MNNIKYNFVSIENKDMLYNPEPCEFTYYQLCKFPNSSQKFGIRRIKINEKYDVIEQKEKFYDKNKILNFIKKTPKYKYSIYPTYSLDMVTLPRPDQIIGANSDLLK
jgi:hypothetical protein